MLENEIAHVIKRSMSESRFRHVTGVVETADHLANTVGEDVEKARIAAWIHDYAREWGIDRLTEVASRQPSLLQEATVPELLHGPVASLVMAETFGVTDPDVANAIRYHTTGRVGMSMLERVVCLADAIEPGRSYPGVEEIRSVAETNLTQALAMSFDSTITYLLQRHRPIALVSVAVRNELWQEVASIQGKEGVHE